MKHENAPVAATGGEPAKATSTLQLDLRQITHDISSPLGTLRMAVYFLETAKPEESKRGEYYAMMSNNIDRIEEMIRRLRVLGDSLSVQKDQIDGSR